MPEHPSSPMSTSETRAPLLFGAGLCLLLLLTCPGHAQARPAASCRTAYPLTRMTGSPPLGGFLPHIFAWSSNGRDLAYLIRKLPKGPNTLVVIDAKSGHVLLQAGTRRLGAALRPSSSIHNDRIREWTGRYGLVNYRWAPHGHHLLFINGREIGWIGLKSGHVTPLVRVQGWPSQYTLSPRDHWLSYVYHHTIELKRRGTPARSFPILRATQGLRIGALDWAYREELGMRSGYAWSPQGHELAFIEFDERGVMRFPLVNNVRQDPTIYWQRYPEPGAQNPRARLGLYDTRTHQVRWVHIPGVRGGYLARFGWYEGGHALYAEVLNRPQTHLTLYRISPKTLAQKVILSVTDPDWIDVHNDLDFLPHGGFIFGTDSSGWHHLYRFSPNGRVLASLTPGPANVARLLSVSVHAHRVYYLISPGTGPRSERIESVSFDGHHRHRVFPSRYDENAIFSPHHHYVILTESGPTTPPVITLRALHGPLDRLLAEAKLPHGMHLRAPHFLRIPSSNPHIRINAEIFYPRHFNPHHRYPVVMYQYGGQDVPALVSRGWNPWIVYNERLTCERFIVFEAENHAANTFSQKQQALVKYRLGRLELADQIAAVHWLQKKPYVDGARIGMWGWSYGGYMTLYELTHAPRVWHAGIAVAPVTRWQDYDSIYTERYMSTPEANPKGYRESSDVRAAGRLRAHLLIVAGTGDDNVHWQNTLQFIQALVRADRPYRLLIFPNNTHVLSGHHTRLELFRSMNRFWKETLLPRRRD